MKKLVILSLLLFILSCTKETTIYIETANFNNLSEIEIDQIRGVGEIKIEKIMNELEKGKFKGKKDFEERMKGVLSDEMILKIGNGYNFTSKGGT